MESVANMTPASMKYLLIANYMTFCTIAGMLGNLVMFLESLLPRGKRSTPEITIAAICFFDCFHLAVNSGFSGFLLYGAFSEHTTCNEKVMNLLPEIGFASTGPFLICLAIDRLILVVSPTRYKNLKNYPLRYHAALFAIPIGLLINQFINYLHTNFGQEACNNPADSVDTFVKFNDVFMVITITGIIYMFVMGIFAALTKNCSSKSTSISTFARAVYLAVPWVLSVMAFHLANVMDIDQEIRELIVISTDFVFTIVITCNVLVYPTICASLNDDDDDIGIFSVNGMAITDPGLRNVIFSKHMESIGMM